MRPRYLIGLTLIVLVLVLSVSLAFALVASRGSNSTEDQLIEGLRPYQEQLDFQIVVPSYLPGGTGRTPTDVVLDDNYIEFKLMAKESTGDDGPDFANVFVRQAPAVDDDCDSRFIRYKEEREIAGEQVQTFRSDSGGSLAGVFLFAQVRQMCVEVQVGWLADESTSDWEIRLTREMEVQADKIFESVIENAHA